MAVAQAQAKDYIGMWYRARARHGIDDSIRFGVIDPDAGDIRWHRFPHRRFDGIGALAHLLRDRGLSPGRLPELREARAPGWWRLLPAMLAPAADRCPAPPWRRGTANTTEPVLAVSWASRVETDMIKRNAEELGVSLSVLLLWALHQMVTRRLLRCGGRGKWFFPVNMRGPVRLARDEMNHSSGFYLDLEADWTPMDVRDQVRQELEARRHWSLWYQARIGRLVGQAGVNWLYDRMVGGSGCLGSFSMIGEWWQEMSAVGWPGHGLLCFCGPGSPDHPVSNGALIWNGRLTQVLQFHPVLGQNGAMVERCLHDWRALLLDPGAMEAVA